MRLARSARDRGPGLVARVGLVLCQAVVVSCAPTQHTPEPYRSDPAAARALEARAEALCAARPAAVRTQPIRPFVTDGCSAWPDRASYLECCVEHDLLYWCGGTAAERAAADDRFGRCVAERSSSFLGAWMRLGVRVGGHPIFPTAYRWGYGLEYSGGHTVPEPAEATVEEAR